MKQRKAFIAGKDLEGITTPKKNVGVDPKSEKSVSSGVGLVIIVAVLLIIVGRISLLCISDNAKSRKPIPAKVESKQEIRLYEQRSLTQTASIYVHSVKRVVESHFERGLAEVDLKEQTQAGEAQLKAIALQTAIAKEKADQEDYDKMMAELKAREEAADMHGFFTVPFRAYQTYAGDVAFDALLEESKPFRSRSQEKWERYMQVRSMNFETIMAEFPRSVKN